MGYMSKLYMIKKREVDDNWDCTKKRELLQRVHNQQQINNQQFCGISWTVGRYGEFNPLKW